MTDKHIDRMAEKVAVALNGGSWATHYTERQKELWRARIRHMLGIGKP